VSKYYVVIEGAESVWTPVSFDDFDSALVRAIEIAHLWKDMYGAPRIEIRGTPGLDPQEANWFLDMERFRSEFVTGD
jgi:hypothetical protein